MNELSNADQPWFTRASALVDAGQALTEQALTELVGTRFEDDKASQACIKYFQQYSDAINQAHSDLKHALLCTADTH